MAKLGRVLQKIFALNSNTGGVGVGEISKFGSFAAGTPATENPSDAGAAALQTLSNYLDGWFSAIAGGNSPVMEDMNGLHFLFSRQLASIFQDGISGWEIGTTYFIGSLVTSGTTVYQSIKDNNTGNAISDRNNWKIVFNTSLNPQVTPTLASRAVATWTAGTTPESNHYEDACWSPELAIFCAISYDGTHQVVTSTDGITWTNRTASVAKLWTAICWSPELKLFVAVAQDNASTNSVMTSPDGVTWTTRTASAQKLWQGVCWSAELGLFIAVSGDGSIMSSANGTSWTTRTSPEANQWSGVIWSPQLLIFVMVGMNGTHRVQTSPDGINWTSRSVPAQSWSQLCWSADLGAFVAVENGGFGISMISYDGINWVTNALPDVGATYEHIVWVAELGLFVTVSQDGATRISTSPDGITWTGRTAASANNWDAIAWSPKLGILVSLPIDASGVTMYSKYVQKFIAP